MNCCTSTSSCNNHDHNDGCTLAADNAAAGSDMAAAPDIARARSGAAAVPDNARSDNAAGLGKVRARSDEAGGLDDADDAAVHDGGHAGSGKADNAAAGNSLS